MRTKRQFWDLVVAELSLSQYRRAEDLKTDRSYDALFTAALQVSKSKKIRSLCLAGHMAPLVNRFSLMGVESNSFGDQIIRYYDMQKHESGSITNQEGSHECVQTAIDYLNRNAFFGEEVAS